MARWRSLFALLAVMAAPAVARDKPLLFPVDARTVAADVVACVRHMSATGLDPVGLEAEGWRRYEVSDLPERPFLAGTPLYSRGDGLVVGYVAAGALHSGCTLVILPKPTTALAEITDEVSAVLAVKPVFERDGERGHETLWAPNGATGMLLLLTKDPRNAQAINIVIRPHTEAWENKVSPQPRPLNDTNSSQSPKN